MQTLSTSALDMLELATFRVPDDTDTDTHNAVMQQIIGMTNSGDLRIQVIRRDKDATFIQVGR